MNKIAILIPCFNESKTIQKVIRDFHQVLPEANIYVYDNNSTDGTDQISKAAGAFVRYEYRQGKGNVLRSMFREIDADCYLTVDGDDAFPADKACEMCSLILTGKADMVIGNRLSSDYFKTENKRLFHGFGNELVRKTINFLWQPREPILDVMTGYRAFSPLFVKSFPILSQGFEIETEMTIHALDKNFLVRSIPIKCRERPAGSISTLNTFTDGIKVLRTIFNLYRYYKPLMFFGIISILLALISIILFIPIFVEFLKTRLVPRFPTFIGSCVIMIMALLSLVCGLILDSNAQNDRRNYEIRMNFLSMLLGKFNN